MPEDREEFTEFDENDLDRQVHALFHTGQESDFISFNELEINSLCEDENINFLVWVGKRYGKEVRKKLENHFEYEVPMDRAELRILFELDSRRGKALTDLERKRTLLVRMLYKLNKPFQYKKILVKEFLEVADNDQQILDDMFLLIESGEENFWHFFRQVFEAGDHDD